MYSYANKWLDVDLTNKTCSEFQFDEETLRLYLGGAGLGAKILYDRVQPGVEWDDPENCVIICGGPINGTRIAGSGAHCQITKGPLTNGLTSVQAMGFLGAYMSTAGIDGIVLHGKSPDWVYLVVDDGKIEFFDATELLGLDTYETELAVKRLIGAEGKKSSVYTIGLAGENLVRFACVVGDRGHVCAHNGIGAVWGSKKVKAVAVKRGSHKVELYDPEKVKELARGIVDGMKNHPLYSNVFNKGTSFLLGMYYNQGLVPYKNLTTSVIPEDFVRLKGDYYRTNFESKREPCYGCPSHHCNIIKVTEGKHAGFEGEEPEYELMAGMGTLIGNPDPGAAIMLANQWDFIGCDGNEGSWLMGFAIECYEKGLLTKEDTGGLELTWGNTDAVYELIWKIARKEPGIGALLSEGVKRSAEAIGGEALNIGVYQMRGHAPRGHDHRARWIELLDTAVSGCGTNETTHPLLKPDDAFDPEVLANILYKGKTRVFVDSLVACMFPTRSMNHIEIDHLYDIINAATGWDMTPEEGFKQALRSVNLFRIFNLRHGIGPEVEYPSVRYGSAPVDGPIQGKCIMDVWDHILDLYYDLMGWDRETGWPKEETLRDLNLDFAIQYIPQKN